jgi:hypothetical protein
MPGFVADGKGTLEGIPVELSLAVIETPSSKYLLMVGAADSDALSRHAPTIMKILRGLQPTAG